MRQPFSNTKAITHVSLAMTLELIFGTYTGPKILLLYEIIYENPLEIGFGLEDSRVLRTSLLAVLPRIWMNNTKLS